MEDSENRDEEQAGAVERVDSENRSDSGEEKRNLGDVNAEPAVGDETERLRSLRGELDFDIGRSRRYSAKLSTHFARWERRSTMLTLLSGSSVVVSILAEWPILNAVAATVVVIASLCSIGLRWSEESLHYTKQYRAYTELAVRFARLGSSMTFDQYRQMKADYLQIESLERSPLAVLNAICYKEECAYRKEPDGGITLRWWQSLLAHWIDTPPEPKPLPPQPEPKSDPAPAQAARPI